MRIGGWEGIRAEVMRRIRAREWGPGDFIPTEAQLAEEFGCARATVNRALRDLASVGVLERRRKAGTRVALNPVRRAQFDIPVIRAEVEGRGLAYGFDLLHEAMEIPPPDVAERMAGPRSLLHLRGLHRADGEPLLLEDRWLDPGLLPDVPRDFSQVSPNEWLVRHMLYTSGQIAFSAAEAEPVEAELLGVAPGAALFVVERMTWAGLAPITFVRLAYRPGYRVEAEM